MLPIYTTKIFFTCTFQSKLYRIYQILKYINLIQQFVCWAWPFCEKVKINYHLSSCLILSSKIALIPLDFFSKRCMFNRINTWHLGHSTKMVLLFHIQNRIAVVNSSNYEKYMLKRHAVITQAFRGVIMPQL